MEKAQGSGGPRPNRPLAAAKHRASASNLATPLAVRLIGAVPGMVGAVPAMAAPTRSTDPDDGRVYYTQQVDRTWSGAIKFEQAQGHALGRRGRPPRIA